MATASETRAPYLVPITPDALRRRNADAIRLLDQFEAEGDEQEQREAMDVLRRALGPDRIMSTRDAFK
jgi:hypothetical protein